MSFNVRAFHAPLPGSPQHLAPGTTLSGKWKGKSYHIMERIGQGANGTVYLASRDGELVALKIAHDASALSIEHDNLIKLGVDSRGRSIAPRALEIDDLKLGVDTHPALAMEYVGGQTVAEFVAGHGPEWVPVLLVKILRLLGALHERGYIFGDLKPANLLIHPASVEPRLIDFGGVTPQGQAVKEFTEMFDRAWWGLGTRRAEPGYDLAAAALLALHVLGIVKKTDVERLASSRPAARQAWLFARLNGERAQTPLIPSLMQALQGVYPDTSSFVSEVIQLLEHNPIVASEIQAAQVTVPPKRARAHRPWDITDWGLLIAIIVFTSTLALLIWI